MCRQYKKHSHKILVLLLGLNLLPQLLIAQDINKNTESDSSGLIKINRSYAPKTEPATLFSNNQLLSTAAVSSVTGEVLYKIPSSNLINTLSGQLNGLTVLQGSGAPGSTEGALWIRGAGSYNAGNYTIYLNGFQTTYDYLQHLSPSEIDNIAIFKDAASLATFGVKGANGVVWVTTKRGEAGKIKIQLQARTSFQRPVNINKPLGSFDYASLYNQAASNDNGRVWSPVYSADQLANYKNGTGINTDWYKETIKSVTPLTTADVTLSGGTQEARYFVMMGYTKDEGLYKVHNDDTHANESYQQFNLRTGLDFKMFSIFEGKVDLAGRTEDKKGPNFSDATLWNNLAGYPSNIYNAKNGNGTWPGTSSYPNNPLASINELGTNSFHDRTIQASFTLKEKLDFITKGLYLSEAGSYNSWSRGSYNVTKNYARVIDTTNQTTDQNTIYAIYDDRGTNQWNWSQFQAQLGFDSSFGLHKISAAVNYLQSVYNTDANLNGSAGINMKYANINLAGKFHYEYNNRYSAEFGFAYSGSDNYAKGNRYGFYPSLSAAWNIAKENFLSKSKNINSLKLRVSAGKSGYDYFAPGRYLYQQYYANSGAYATGNATPTWNGGIIQSNLPDEAISAEQSMKYNIGLDATIFKNLTVTIDAYEDKRSKIITKDNSLLAVFGTEAPYKNIGKVTNRGLEASISFNNKINKLNYQVGVFAAYNTNKINYMAEVPAVTPGAAQTGKSIGTPFGYEANGFYASTDFDATGNLKTGIPVPGFGAVQPGDIKYKDLNGDNKIDEKDVVPIGNSYVPKLTYSFVATAELSGFDVRLQLQGIAGRSVNLLDAGNQAVAFKNNGTAYEIAKASWAYYPDQGIDTRASATYPRLSLIDNKNNYRNSTFWMKDGSFLRLRNIELGYSFTSSFLKHARLSGVRVYVSAVNLVTWSPLLKSYHIDPETMTGYPELKSINVGFTVKF